jgi:DHA2 family multidrug resistance protein
MMLDLGERRDWFASELIRWLGFLSLIGVAAFIIRENLTRDPLINMKLFRSRSYSMGVLLMGLIGFVLYGAMVLVPLHAQHLLGYSALVSGEIMAPMGIATLFTMPLAGKLVNRVDARLLMVIGAGLLAWSMSIFTGLNLDAGFWELTIPRFIQGLALGFIFVPLTTATMSGIAQAQTNAASGFFNLARNVGGSIGIALMGTFLTRRGQFHQTGLVEHITPYGEHSHRALDAAASVLAHRGLDPILSGKGALEILYGEIRRQSLMNAFLDDYWLLSVITLLIIPLIFILKRPDTTATPPI